MKVLSTDGLTKLIQLIKNGFISVDDTVSTSTVTLATVATSGSYNDLSNKPTIPTATSDLTNDSGFITSTALTPYALISSLSTVATSGSYTDLSDKPTIGNGTITFTQGGVTKGTITTNQSGNTTIDFDAGGGSSRNVGEIISSTLPLTDAGLHLLDGARLSGDGIYGEFVQYIADLYAENPTANYFTTEALWQQSVTTYGVCGKFVYDSTNNTVRLPKVTGIIEGTTDVSALGDLIEAGLPNIQGVHWLVCSSPSGAFYSIGGGGRANLEWHGDFTHIGFDASRSNSIYGNSNTVQPQAIKVLYYIVVATSIKTDIQVDIDEIATDLNGKADVDLSNINASQSAKNEIISWGLPDLSNGITYANDTTVHTAPSDGYILLSGRANSGSLTFYINGINIGWSYASNSYATGMSWFVPVSKGDTFYINQSYTSNVYRFYPMKGSN